MDTPHTFEYSRRALRLALDILVVILIIVILVPRTTWQVAACTAVFGVIYLAGSIGPLGRARTGDTSTEVAVTSPSRLLLGWLILLLASWVVLSATTLDATFLVFPLFFVILQVTGGITAVLLVILTTAAAIATISLHTELTLGGILGPIIVGGFALLVGLGFRLIQHETMAKTKALEELSAARAHSEALARHAGELDERARLAADIHDTVAQGLSSIQLLLHSVEGHMDPAQHDPQDIANVRMARKVAAENLAETRRILAALQPAPLTNTTLPGAIATVCSTTPLGDAVSFCVDGEPTPLPAHIEALLVRVTQSSLSNVVKHAQATSCRVTLTYQPDDVILDIVDNGMGFDPSSLQASALENTPGYGMGMITTRRRVESIGGSFTVESSPGHGCGISICLPYTQ